MAHFHREAGLFQGLANGSVFDALASIQEAAGKDPFAIAGLNPALQQENLALYDWNGAGRDFGIVIEDERTTPADQPFGFVGLEQLAA